MCGDNLGGGRWRRRAQVGDKIGDGKINFVADGGNNRNRGSSNRAGHHLFIKSPKVFDGSATASYYHYINPGVQIPISDGARMEVIEELNRAHDLLRRA